MTHRPTALTPIVLLVLALALIGCTGPAGLSTPSDSAEPSEAAVSDAPASETPASEATTDAPQPAAVEVRIQDPDFIPERLTVALGTEVTWVNDDAYEHTVSEGTDGDVVDDPIVDEPIAAGGTLSVTFDEPGTYDITCRIHPTMQMTVVVEG